ncbi:NADPH:quinone reductase-like Zn-dependent oxidoreductase [Saccharopolyspora lacisalsi]|uniref:NADPH:quinone reductase-like Zn-dependent oxidoreductase n=1 Tax=Halosaccharopolyspora lacisalsi TaxID=1000566 RepID=A0A839DWZ8_9PSEU|nr:NADP-dependent oxidoreductase [Halosaccharopolyspora lacisalsi]MBA8825563.1 NADPH:quinone reductase-like Zn-dependent oxidoreductase [Halosaccharopolyspora lacisalsi]
MKAIALTEFGEPGVMHEQELPDPLVGPDTVLVEVRAAGVNPVDWKVRRGYLQGMIPHHTPLIPGWDVAGVVRAVGPAVTEYRSGDEVLGYAREDHVQNGTYAELVSAPVRTLAHKPRSLEFTRAAGLPLAGLTALQMLRATDAGEGDVVLVHAASGGVGHLAVQIARELGVSRVIGTASEGNHEFLRELGAEPVTYGDGLPSRVADLVGGDGKVDVALDFVGGQALTDSVSMVRRAQRHASVQDAETVLNQGGRYVFVRPDSQQLGWLAELVDEGRLRVEIQRTLPLEQAEQSHELLERGHVRGKLVLTTG